MTQRIVHLKRLNVTERGASVLARTYKLSVRTLEKNPPLLVHEKEEYRAIQGHRNNSGELRWVTFESKSGNRIEMELD